MRRFRVVLPLVALCVIAVAPSAGTAATSTYGPPYAMGPRGGDMFNHVEADATTGEMTVLRANPAGISGGLGCAGSGGWASFELTVASPPTISEVAVLFTDAVVDPYTWITVGVLKDLAFVGSHVQRGLLLGGGAVPLRLREPVQAPVTIRFGIQVSSACPNINGGHAVFTQIQASSV